MPTPSPGGTRAARQSRFRGVPRRAVGLFLSSPSTQLSLATTCIDRFTCQANTPPIQTPP
ncbi:hypothetical protein EJO68_19660 [Variovorax atrisoli]|nr:hypothetical protein EJO68_19660 [Variovorax sp. 369]